MSLRLVYMNSRPCHIIWSYCCPYTDISIQFTVAPSLFHISGQFEVRYIPFIVSYMPHVTRFSLNKHWTLSCYLILPLFIYRYKYQFTVSPSLFHISTQFDVRYYPLLVPYTPHVTRISLYELQTLSYHMILLLAIYRYKYSLYRISVAICHI
jgi:hypothetical protein